MTPTADIIRLNLSLSYVKPGDHGEPVTTTRTCDEVLAVMTKFYIVMNRESSSRGKARQEPSEEQIIDDYIAVNWATVSASTQEEPTATGIPRK